MKLIEIIKNIESWAPKEIAWQKDNVGLQIGDYDKKVKNMDRKSILARLDMTLIIFELVLSGIFILVGQCYVPHRTSA